MKVYIAGKLQDPLERERLEELDELCKSLNLETYLPHRDGGLARSAKDTQEIFKKDIEQGMQDCQLLIADLDGLHVGAGTAWELGYAYSKGIKILGLKTDESLEDAFDYLSPILLGSMKILTSKESLVEEIKKIINQGS